MRQESFKKVPLWYDMLLMLNWNKNTLGTKKNPQIFDRTLSEYTHILKNINNFNNQSVNKPYIAINMRNFKVDNA